MLNICYSNSVEVLLHQLAHQLASSPLDAVFTPETIITPSPAMARWINIELAKHHGIAANIDYPLPSSFIWRIARDILKDIPERDPLSISAMSWKGFRLLPELLDMPAFEPLKYYLENDTDGIKRWQLCAKIADTFDRYQLFRPDLIRKWSRGEDDDWQAVLWRKLLSTVSHHRVANIERLQHYLHKNTLSHLPVRISFFAVSHLPPYFIEVIHALSQHTQFDLYIHSPTPEFWADLKSQKELASKRIARPDEASLWEAGNDLLASWGRQGQALQDLLLQGENPINEVDAFVEPQRTTLLTCLQNDIYTVQSESRILPAINSQADTSLQIHVCHSPQRECQVLHDQLLNMFQQDAELKPEDVLVMIPEINLYAPYIEAVFHYDEAASRPYIPWNLSDISIKDEHPVIQVFLQLLNLPQSRFTHSEISSYLDVPEMAQRFDLDNNCIEKIKQWLIDTNLRWGIDDKHKTELDLPAYVENTWQQTEDRLFSAYALPSTELFEGMAPIARMEGSEAEILGKFWHFIETLKKYRTALTLKRTTLQWQEFLSALINQFFMDDDEDETCIQKIRDTIAELAEQGAELDEAVSINLLRYWLSQQLNAETRRGRYFTGGVTFCGMRPMRSVPFKIICVLGMHDQAFPRRENMAEFDLMAASRRVGDPRKGEEDRYLFLQTLLCARNILYISYIGRDIRSNEVRQASVLVQELLDHIDYFYASDNKDTLPLSHRISTTHTLQAFSRQNFSGPESSFDGYWCRLANSIKNNLQTPDKDSVWNDPEPAITVLPDSGSESQISISSLLYFVRNPVKLFINSRLHIYLENESLTDDDEIFSPDPLQVYLLSQRLLDSEFNDTGLTIQQLKAEGELPHGIFAEPWFDTCNNRILPVKQALKEYVTAEPQHYLVNLTLEDTDGEKTHIYGEFNNIYHKHTLLRYKASKLKGSDIPALWLEHLIWCLTAPEQNKKSILFCRDKSLSFNSCLSADSARQHLATYIRLYKKAKTQPLPVFPASSYEYARSLLDKSGQFDPAADIDKALQKASAAWNGNSFSDAPSDKDDPYIQIIMHGVTIEPVLHKDFSLLAKEFYLQALEQGEIHEFY